MTTQSIYSRLLASVTVWSELCQHEGKLTAMTTVVIQNNTEFDMVIAPGSNLGEMDIMTGRDSTINQIREERIVLIIESSVN